MCISIVDNTRQVCKESMWVTYYDGGGSLSIDLIRTEDNVYSSIVDVIRPLILIYKSYWARARVWISLWARMSA